MPTKLNGIAYGKLNLTLEVIGRRQDGFHELRSLMQAISIHDVVTVKEANEVSINCNLAGISDFQNIAYKAAELMRRRYKVKSGADIVIQKGIPVSAGLGGGSSDAAMVLKLLNKLWGLDLPLSELVGLSSEIGSDVAFFLSGNTGLVEGRGEKVRCMDMKNTYYFVLLVPPVTLRCKTASMYVTIFQSAGGKEILTAGSGPTLFTIVSTRERGTAISLILKHKYKLNSFLVTSVNKSI